MALHIADYLIIRDEQGQPANFALPEDDPDRKLAELQIRTFNFSLPSHAAVGDTGILAYVLDGVPRAGELDIEYDIVINGHSLHRTTRIQSSMTRGLWGLVRSNWLFESPAENVLEFQEIRRRSNGGYLTFNNIVLWFQRSVAEP